MATDSTKEKISITCDRCGVLWRVVVWQGKHLRDLYFDWMDRPNLTGAVVGGKISRVISSKNIIHSCFVDCGLDQPVQIDKPPACKTGDFVSVKIKTLPREAKGYGGTMLKLSADERVGVITPPPRPWQIAINDLEEIPISSITFENKGDWIEAEAWLKTHQPKTLSALSSLAKQPLHPDLQEAIDLLLKHQITLCNGVNLIIETTQTLTSIDVNSPNSGNPLAVNIQAIKSIAQQIRWRNLSGIIVVDCLKMKARTDTDKLLQAARIATADDPAGVDIFGVTKLGLLEMIRSRRGYSLAEMMQDIE